MRSEDFNNLPARSWALGNKGGPNVQLGDCSGHVGTPKPSTENFEYPNKRQLGEWILKNYV